MKALIIVDIQNDFIPGGSLPVEDGESIIPLVNEIQSKFELVVATQDWHPHDHKSFASMHEGKKPFDVIELNGLTQVLWPDHCVQNSAGADFHPALHTSRIEAIFRKGMDPEIDSYSGFFDNGHRKSTGLAGYLRERAVQEVYVCGLAADYCVYFTALDALREQFRTFYIKDATRYIDEKGFKNALSTLAAGGAMVIHSTEV